VLDLFRPPKPVPLPGQTRSHLLDGSCPAVKAYRMTPARAAVVAQLAAKSAAARKRKQA
jgi:hypothetical protein